MSLRRSHKKSYGGCNQCKSRRVKCDERGPPCYSCIARDVACEYSQKAQLARKNQDEALISCSTTSSSDPEPLCNRAIGALLPGVHLFELELMNHWTAHTYLTFCHQRGQPSEYGERQLWQTILPQEGFRHDCCLKALFAVTSLHMSSLATSSLRERYLTAAIDYQNVSLERFRNALSSVTITNCQAMYACSLAQFVLGIALTELDQTRGSDRSAKDSILSVLALFAGSKKIMNLFEDQLTQMPMAVAIARKDMRCFPDTDNPFRQAVRHLRRLNEDRYQKINAQVYILNRCVLNELEAASVRDCNGVGAALIGWLMTLDEEFVVSLGQNEVISTLSMMHWTTLIKKDSELWWTFKSNTRLMAELYRSLPNLTAAEQQACDWCLNQVGIQ